MGIWAMLRAALGRHRLDAALAGLLFLGSLGFTDGTTWLSAGPNAFVAITPPPPAAHAPAQPPLPKLAYSSESDGRRVGGGGGFPLTRFLLPKSDLTTQGLPGGDVGDHGGGPIHDSGPVPQGIALGNGASPLQGGFAAPAAKSAPAVPEPSTWALMVLGFVLVLVAGRRRGQARLT